MDDLPVYPDTVTVMRFVAQLNGANLTAGVSGSELTVDWIMDHYWQTPPNRESI